MSRSKISARRAARGDTWPSDKKMPRRRSNNKKAHEHRFIWAMMNWTVYALVLLLRVAAKCLSFVHLSAGYLHLALGFRKRVCAFCGRRDGDSTTAPPLRKCVVTGDVWYCNEVCQIYHWPFHMYDCLPEPGFIPSRVDRRPPSSNPTPVSHLSPADHLLNAVADDLVPEDPQTCKYFGFDRAPNLAAQCKLLGVYIGLIKYHEVPIEEIDRWRQEGRLLQGIKGVFEKLPASNRGGYYPWLMDNQHILAPR